MKTNITTKNKRTRKLALTSILLTVGTPILALIMAPNAAPFIIPLAIALPFITMSCLESMLHNHAQA